MASNPANNPTGAVVVDANVLIALASREAGRAAKASGELTAYLGLGYLLYAPGVIITETMYVLCGKLSNGALSALDYPTAISTFQRTMRDILPPPHGDVSLIHRADQIRAGYGCSRSADAFYIALAEELGQYCPTVLLTFDKDLPNQVARNAAGVIVNLL
jgi:predicted nucleic acid-binding protein